MTIKRFLLIGFELVMWFCRDENNGATMMESPSSSVWKESWVAIKDVTKLRTFQIIVLQGIVGSVPWNAMLFWTMWFELIGIHPNQTYIFFISNIKHEPTIYSI